MNKAKSTTIPATQFYFRFDASYDIFLSQLPSFGPSLKKGLPLKNGYEPVFLFYFILLLALLIVIRRSHLSFMRERLGSGQLSFQALFLGSLKSIERSQKPD